VIRISRRAEEVEDSPTLALTARARALRQQGRPIISFTVGEPDFVSPAPVLDAARRAIDEGQTKYSPAAGYPELRRAIVKEHLELTGTSRKLEEVLVSNGAKQVLYNLLQALVDPGDSVLFCAPYWVSYPWMVQLAGGRSEIIQTRASEGFRIDPKELKGRLAASGARVVILNSPSNPTGAVYSPSELNTLVDICLDAGCVVISDEIYALLVYGDNVFQSAAAPDTAAHRERVIVVNGVSKSYAMTGWRIGYAIGPKAVIDAASRIQSHSTSSPASVSQFAAVGALEAGFSCAEPMLKAFRERRQAMIEELAAIPHITLHPPGGAFYAFPEMSYYCTGLLGNRKIESDWDLAEALLEEADVAVVPGSAFGTPGSMRLSFALGIDDLREGMKRVRAALGRWRPS
jgi:aspartate aminotransferase